MRDQRPFIIVDWR